MSTLRITRGLPASGNPTERAWVNRDEYRDVLYVLDDRQQVVAMWRALGLTVFQVAEGAF